MKLQLSVNVPDYPFNLDYSDHIFSVGSCFSEHMSRKMLEHGFYVESNPWGILFNPITISELILTLNDSYKINENILPIKREESWFSLLQHSQFHAASENKLVDQISQVTQTVASQFESSGWLIVTFGTAFVYEYKPSGNRIVANCQKLPKELFEKRLLSVNEIVECWTEIFQNIGNKKILFTVSPVRHSKDGLIENTMSKSVLILAVQELIRKYEGRAFYFPSYEIMLDELRDYRYFNDDLVHPTPLAIQYIWEKWCESVYTPETWGIAKEFQNLYLLSQHRPIVQANKKNLQDIFIEKKNILMFKYPFLNGRVFEMK